MGKKILFIGNIFTKITNFTIPSIKASQDMGYEFHLAGNMSGFSEDFSKYNITIHHIDLARNPFSIKNIKAYKQMLALIKEEKFDVIHCNTPVGGLLGRLCGKKAKVPKVIYTVHGFHFYKGAPIINNTLYKWAEMWMARYTDTIITINQDDFKIAQQFKLRNNGESRYVPGVGVNTSIIKETNCKRQAVIDEIGVPRDPVLLISIGELNKNKNNIAIVKALAKLQKSNIHYILCGVGDKEIELAEFAKKSNIDKNIHFMGYRNDIPQLLKSCDIFVMPSYREGLSRSIMEAMSAGLPCVVSKIRGNVDLVEEGQGGYLCEPNDVDRFAEVIKALSEDKVLRGEIGEYNLEKVKMFDVEYVLDEIKRIYKEELK